ncbi:MAG: hypothetical protein QNL88_06675, partial [Acidobacteriota bacterium]|nr:hypothetical protein [Acidobacteriota bacterium]
MERRKLILSLVLGLGLAVPAQAAVHTIQPTSALPTITDPVILDGTTHPDFVDQPVIEIDGSLAVGGNGLTITAGSSTVRGLVIHSFDASGIWLQDLGGNTIVGNYVGTDATGLVGEVGNYTDGIGIYQSPNNVIGGTTSADRNIISGNRLRGILIDDNSDGATVTSAGTRIIGNYVGTDASGDNRTPYDNSGIAFQQIGIYCLDAVDTEIGGSSLDEGNVISGNDWHGVYIWGPNGHDNLIKGNILGLDVTRTNTIGNGFDNSSRSAIHLSNAPANTVGGTEAGASNEIAGNLYLGVTVNGDDAVQNRILGNSIHDNGGMGIDLGLDGVTSNDDDDADPGTNNLQNFPVLDSAVTDESTTMTVNGSLNSLASTTFRVEFFTNAAGDGTGNGEGETYLDFTDVTTDINGDDTFSFPISATIAAGDFISATATDPDGNTSEFGETIQAVVASDLQLAKIVDNNAPNEGDTVTYTVTLTNAGPNDATGITVTDLLPSGVTYVSDTPSQGTYVNGTGLWTVGGVTNASNSTLTLVATVDGGTAGTTITNNASITGADQADSDGGNNTDSAGITVSSSDLQLAKVVDNNAPNEGDTVTYTVTLTNAGPNDATGVTVTDLLPAGVTYVSDTPSQGSYVSGTGLWTVGGVTNASNATLTLVATVDGGTAGTTVTNNASIAAADQTDPDGGNNTDSAGVTVSSADLQLAKVVDNNAPNEGDTVTYTVTLTNTGPNDATSIT